MDMRSFRWKNRGSRLHESLNYLFHQADIRAVAGIVQPSKAAVDGDETS